MDTKDLKKILSNFIWDEDPFAQAFVTNKVINELLERGQLYSFWMNFDNWNFDDSLGVLNILLEKEDLKGYVWMGYKPFETLQSKTGYTHEKALKANKVLLDNLFWNFRLDLSYEAVYKSLPSLGDVLDTHAEVLFTPEIEKSKKPLLGIYREFWFDELMRQIDYRKEKVISKIGAEEKYMNDVVFSFFDEVKDNDLEIRVLEALANSKPMALKMLTMYSINRLVNKSDLQASQVDRIIAIMKEKEDKIFTTGSDAQSIIKDLENYKADLSKMPV